MATPPNESSNPPPESPWAAIIVACLFVFASGLIFIGVLYHPPQGAPGLPPADSNATPAAR